MKQVRQNKLLTRLSLLLGLTALIGCYEPTEGCVEYWAVNYDVLADELCDDCCTAPEVRVAIKYLLPDSSEYRFGDTILLESGTYVSLHSANMMLSHFDLFSAGLEVAAVNDSVTIDNVTYESDFEFSTSQGKTIKLSEYEEPFVIDGISFLQGLHPTWQDTSIFGLDNSIIAEAIDSLYVPMTDDFTRFSCTVSADTINQDTIHSVSTLRDTLRYNLSALDPMTLDPILLNLGEHTTITLKVNVKDWFDKIDYDPDNVETLANDLISALPDIITVE